MKKAAFSLRLTKEEQKRMAARYHFEDTQLYRIHILYEALLPVLKAEAYYEIVQPDNGEEGALALCAVTLGNGIDRMQEDCGGSQSIMDDYILECLGSTLLEKAYAELGEVLFGESGLFFESFLFPGSDLELEWIAKILDRLSEEGRAVPISYNREFVLLPKKSVVFIGRLGKKGADCGVCASCPRADCESRAAEGRKR